MWNIYRRGAGLRRSSARISSRGFSVCQYQSVRAVHNRGDASAKCVRRCGWLAAPRPPPFGEGGRRSEASGGEGCVSQRPTGSLNGRLGAQLPMQGVWGAENRAPHGMWREAAAMALGETTEALRSAPQEHDVSAEGGRTTGYCKA